MGLSSKHKISLGLQEQKPKVRRERSQGNTLQAGPRCRPPPPPPPPRRLSREPETGVGVEAELTFWGLRGLRGQASAASHRLAIPAEVAQAACGNEGGHGGRRHRGFELLTSPPKPYVGLPVLRGGPLPPAQ